MLVELGVVEQRYQAVLEVLGGATVVDVARRYGVARQTVHGWLRRYASDDRMAGLVDRSSKPDTCPHQTPAAVEARIVEMRRAHRGWGPRTIGSSPGDSWSGGHPQGRFFGQRVVRRQQLQRRTQTPSPSSPGRHRWGTVEISSGGEVIKVHPIRHDRSREHGAFSNPGGRPHRINAA